MRPFMISIGTMIVGLAFIGIAPSATANHDCQDTGYQFYYGVGGFPNPSVGVYAGECLGFVTCTSSGLPCAGVHDSPDHTCATYRVISGLQGDLCTS